MKNAFVTGASTGLGKRVAIELSKRNYNVFLAGRNSDKLEVVKELIINTGHKAEIIALDLLSLESIKNATHKITDKGVIIDILANIAGMYHDEKQHFFDIPFENYPDEAIIKNVNASLVGHILLTKHLVSIMDRGSSIINMSGTFDEGETGVISDFITKNAIEVFSKQLAIELKPKDIRSTCIRPSFIFTENVQRFFPKVKASEALDPTELAIKIADIAEDASKNGEVIEFKNETE